VRLSAETECSEAGKFVKKAISIGDGSKEEEELYRKAISLCPQLAEAHHNLAVLLVEAGSLDDAKTEIVKALALSDSVDFRLALAHILVLKGDLEGARGEYQIVLEKSPQNEKALQGLSYIELENGQEPKSIELLEKALEKNPLDEVSLYNRAVLAERTRNLEGAEQFYKELLRVAPAHPQGVIRLAMLLRKQGHLSQSKEVLDRAVKAGGKNGHFLALLASTSEELGNLEDAEVAYKKLLASKSDDEDALASLASLYVTKRQHQQALETLQRLFAVNDHSARGHTVQGIAYVQLGKFDEAKAALQRAIEEDPTQAVAHYNLSLVYKHEGERALAEQELTRAKVLDPSIVE
jgi:tetratricopeptide (TPR) repeat protein